MARPAPNPMSARIEYTSEGLLAVTISGKFSQDEWSKMQAEAGRLIEQHGPVRILVVAEQFQGWERKGDWGDVSFQAKYDKSIERMAIVAEKQWEDLAVLFTAKGFRPFPIEYF